MQNYTIYFLGIMEYVAKVKNIHGNDKYKLRINITSEKLKRDKGSRKDLCFSTVAFLFSVHEAIW